MKLENLMNQSYRRSLVTYFSFLVAAVILVACPTAYGQGDLDLNTWSQEGDPGAGNWTVAADGTNVFIVPEQLPVCRCHKTTDGA